MRHSIMEGHNFLSPNLSPGTLYLVSHGVRAKGSMDYREKIVLQVGEAAASEESFGEMGIIC